MTRKDGRTGLTQRKISALVLMAPFIFVIVVALISGGSVKYNPTSGQVLSYALKDFQIVVPVTYIEQLEKLKFVIIYRGTASEAAEVFYTWRIDMYRPTNIVGALAEGLAALAVWLRNKRKRIK